MRRFWRTLLPSVGLFLSFILLMPTIAMANQSDDIQYIYDNVKNIDHTADDGNNSVTIGSQAGNNVMHDVGSVSLCGTTITNDQVKNLQSVGTDFPVIRAHNLEEFIQIMGEDYREDISSAFADAEGWQDANGKTYALHKTMSLCGKTFELDVYDVKNGQYLYTDTTIDVVNIIQWDSDTPVSDYRDTNAACQDTNGIHMTPLQNGQVSSDSFRTEQQVQALNYTFNCAGKYHVTWVDYYADGSSKKIDKYITVPRAKIPKTKDPDPTPSNGSLIITK